MPYIRHIRRRDRPTTAVICDATHRAAMYVPDYVWTDWLLRTREPSGAVHNGRGYRMLPYGELDVAVHAPYAAAGIYTDHTDPAVERDAYALRDRLLREMSGDNQRVLESIRQHCGLRHWRDAYNVVRNVGRRATGESGRNTDGDLVWRRWARPRTTTTVTATGETVTTTTIDRRFGIELEFIGGGYHSTIAADVAAAGIAATATGVYNYRAGRGGGWQLGTDCTVSGEFVSPPLRCDNDGLAQVNTVARIIREHGGTAAARQGTHVHVGTGDLDGAHRNLLVANIRHADRWLRAYCPTTRTDGSNHYCSPYTDGAWARITADVAAYGSSSGHRGAYNFAHLTGRHGTNDTSNATIEFRQMGHTLNGRKLRTWIRVVHALVTATAAGWVCNANTTTEFVAQLRTHGGLTRQAAERFVARVSPGQAVAA